MYSALQLGVMSNTEARTDIFGVKTESDIMCMPVYEPITVSSQPLLSHEDYNFLSEANIGENWNKLNEIHLHNFLASTSSTQPISRCDQCGLTFRSFSGLYHHQKTHEGTYKLLFFISY